MGYNVSVLVEVMKIIFLLLTTYKSIWLGSFEPEWLDSSFPEVFFFVVVTFLLLVVMMNLLIAIMSDTFITGSTDGTIGMLSFYNESDRNWL